MMNKRHNLISFRKSIGFTIDDMAVKLNCTRTYLNNIELGKADGSIEFWTNFQDVFGVENYDMWDMLIKGDQ